MDKKDFPVLTGVRFVAASLVYLFHYAKIIFPDQQSFLYFFFRQLNIGVNLFFVLSGFLITYRYFEFSYSGKEFRYYMMKRIARIFPLYLAVIIVHFFLLAVIQNKVPDALTIFLNLTLLHGLSNTYLFSGLTQSWSLTVEEMFYLYAPLCFYFIKARKIFFLQILWLLTIGFALVGLSSFRPLQNFFGDSDYLFAKTFFGRCFEFFVGIFLALWMMKQPRIRKNPAFTLGGGFLFFALLTVLSFYAYAEKISVINERLFGILLFNFLIPLSIGIVYYGLLVENSFVKRMLSSPFFVLLGKSSYAFYLLHVGMLAEMIFFHVTANVLLLYVLLQLLSIAAYKMYEKPIYFLLLRKFGIYKTN